MPPNHFKAFIDLRVGYADTDAQGVLYYGNFFSFFDRARFEYWHQLGLNDKEIKDLEQTTVMVEVHCHYKASAEFYDLLRVYSRVAWIGRSSLSMKYSLCQANSDALLAEGETIVVNTNRETGKSAPLPDQLVTLIKQFEGTSLEARA